MSKHSMVCAGIDTGKHKLDVALDGRTEANCRSTTLRMATRRCRPGCGKHRVKRIGIEASGGYEQAVVAASAPRRLCRHRVPARAGAGLCQVPPATGEERQDRCRADRRLLGRDQDDPCAAGSPFGAIGRASDDDRADHARTSPVSRPAASPAATSGSGSSGRRRSVVSSRFCAASSRQLVAAIRQHRDLAERLDLIASVDGIGPANRCRYPGAHA